MLLEAALITPAIASAIPQLSIRILMTLIGALALAYMREKPKSK